MATTHCAGPQRASVLRLVPAKAAYPAEPSIDLDTIEHLELLLHQAKKGVVVGLAYVAVQEGRGYIADTAGEAHHSPTWTRGALRALDDQLALRIRNDVR